MAEKPRFESLASIDLVGISCEMSREDDRTAELWRRFMPQRDLVPNRTDTNFVSLQVYENGPQQIADSAAVFTKWAAVQVDRLDEVPDGMSGFTLTGGLYAVFDHHGPASDMSTVMHIFGEWLPASNYLLDDREHFEVLPADYSPLDLDAYEEFWIPVRESN